jgi:hypothetical protein
MLPNYKDLQNNTNRYKLLLALKHHEIAEFVGTYFYSKTRIAGLYRMFLLSSAILFLLWTSFIVFTNPTIWSTCLLGFIAGILSFLLLVVPHELIHGLMYKYYGAPRVKYGVIWSKLAFYAIAPEYTISRKEFIPLALAPFIVINSLLIIFIVLSFSNSFWHFYFFGLFLTHSMGCIGDFAMIGFFELYRDSSIYTFDCEKEAISYFYKESE